MGHKHSEATKALISAKRKEWCASNKNQHNWSLYHQQETKPERVFREILEITSHIFTQWYIPDGERSFELDFAQVEKKIAFEINGNQHYNKDGSLAKYYQDRHEYFEALGWKIYEIHYLDVFNQEYINSIILKVIDGIIFDPNYRQEVINGRLNRKKKEYFCIDCGNQISGTRSKRCQSCASKRPRKKKLRQKKQEIQFKYHCIDCGITKSTKTKRCIDCANIASRKVIRPTKEELTKLVWEKPTTQLAKQLGVSDSVISKWCKQYKITKPPSGYWRKLETGKL